MPGPLKNIFWKWIFLQKIYLFSLFIGKLCLHDVKNPSKIFLFLRVFPYTMAGYERLSNAYELAQQAERENLKGAFVECGVWKGGTAGTMAYVSRKNQERPIWLFDSFEGLPEPTSKDGELAKQFVGACLAPLEEAHRLFFSVLQLQGPNIHIEKGWFQNTLPQAKERVGPIAILRLDADWYEFTRCILENLYDNVVPGGYVIIDDYGHWEGCKKAVDEFLKERNIVANLKKIDYTGVYFQK